MKKILFMLMLCAPLFLAAAEAAKPEKYVFDKYHTNILWFASHFGFSDSEGQFAEFDGSITLDESRPENSSVEITIKTASVLTGILKFDEHLKSKDFFNSEKFPEAKFTSNGIEITGENTAMVHGDLTLLGKIRPVILDVTLNKIGKNPFTQQKTAGFTAKTTIKRSEFGMTYGLPGVPDEVKIHIETELLLADPPVLDKKE